MARKLSATDLFFYGLVVMMLSSVFLSYFYLYLSPRDNFEARKAELQQRQRDEREANGMRSVQLEKTIEKMHVTIVNSKKPLIPRNKLTRLDEYQHDTRHTFATMIGSSWVQPYWLGAVAALQALREVQTQVPNFLVLNRLDNSDSVPIQARTALEALGAKIIKVDDIKMLSHMSIPSVWEQAFTKLRIWNMTEYSKIMWMDSDTLVVDNIDHLFNEPELTAPHTPSHCGCGPAWVKGSAYHTVSSGFFVSEPSTARFDQMMDLMTKPSPDPDDAAQYNGSWHWGDQEMLRVVFNQLEDKWNTIDGMIYDRPLGLCDCPKSELTKSYHFTCSYPVPKPFSDTLKTIFTAKPCLRKLNLFWLRVLCKGLVHALRRPKSLFKDLIQDPFVAHPL